ncbi:hypothetical protein [uncultured Jatrophihabitans sp.]|uniref:hypothetical protein n=1 Tax=uncultured Jatrophihabitans sp. TaxID=1610747 RepID=UPI0035CB8C52
MGSRRSGTPNARRSSSSSGREGTLADASRGKLTFAAYVEKYYWPAVQHLEPTTLAAYRSNLDSHFPRGRVASLRC